MNTPSSLSIHTQGPSLIPRILFAALALLGTGLGGVYSSELPDESENWLGIG